MSATVLIHPAWQLRQAIPAKRPVVVLCPRCLQPIEAANHGQADRLLARHLLHTHFTRRPQTGPEEAA